MVRTTDNNLTATFQHLFLLLKIIVIATVCSIPKYASAFENGYSLVLNRSKLSSAAKYGSNSNHPYPGSLLPSAPATTTTRPTTTTTRFGIAKLSCYRRKQNMKTCLSASSSSNIDFQSDTSLYGRGERHLSAIINEEDVVVYQTGTWEVDGVTVGDGDEDAPPTMKYCKVDTLQIIWTHNCEHGFIRGISVDIVSGNDEGSSEEEENSNNSCRIELCRTTPDDDLEFVEFGPEQLLARLPVEWLDDNRERGYLAVPLPKELI